MRNLTVTIFLTIAVIAISKSTAVANEKHDFAPSTGWVYGFEGTGGDSFVKYKCEELSENLIDCQFIATSINNNKTNDDWKIEKKKLVEEFRSLSSETVDEQRDAACEYAENIPNYINGKKSADERVFSDLKEIQKYYLRSMGLYSDKICKEPTEENFLAFREFMYSEEIKTCTIRSHTYRLQFIQQQGDKKAWVAKSEPTGQCGRVYLDRFELGTEPLEIEYGLWNYYQRTAITNPRGKPMDGLLDCSKMDERTYAFTISKRPVFRMCEFIEFEKF